MEYTCLGWVMQDPRSPNIAKTAAEFAGVPHTSPGTTFHENCASGGAAIHSLARRIMLGEVSIGVAGGVESLSNVPRYLFTGRVKNQLYGDMTLVDGLFGALTDSNVGERGELMGLLTERLVERYGVTREEQDEVAFRSHHGALGAWDEGAFSDYVIPVEVPQRKGDPMVVERDEGPRPVTMDELAAARPYFKRDGGTITALNASSVNDGAAVVLLASAERAAELGLAPLAELRAFANIGVAREYMGEGAFKVHAAADRAEPGSKSAISISSKSTRPSPPCSPPHSTTFRNSPGTASTSGAAASRSATRWVAPAHVRSST